MVALFAVIVERAADRDLAGTSRRAIIKETRAAVAAVETIQYGFLVFRKSQSWAKNRPKIRG